MTFIIFTQIVEHNDLMQAEKFFDGIIKDMMRKKIKTRLCRHENKYFLEREVLENETVMTNSLDEIPMTKSTFINHKFPNREVLREY